MRSAPPTRHRWSTYAIVIAGLIVSLLYFRDTTYDVRNYDAASHLKYIKYLADNHSLPEAATCSECHHPPAFHLIGAMGYLLAQACGAEPTRVLQLLSLVIWTVFLGFAALSLERLVRRRSERILATALIVFWPYSIIQSVRVNNDTFLDAVAAATVYALVRWWEQPRTRWLVAAALAATLGLGAKASALTLVGLIGLVVVAKAIQKARPSILLSAAPALVALALTTGLWAWVRHTPGDGLVAGVLKNASASKTTYSRPSSFYLDFLPSEMLKSPYAEIGLKVRDGKASFSATKEPTYWNHMLKSSTYASHTLGRSPVGSLYPTRSLIRFENGMVMGLLVLTLLGFLLGLRDRGGRALLCFVLGTTFVVSGVSFHLLSPNDHHIDFRFIFPVILPFAAMFSWTLRSRWLGLIAIASAAVFLAVSVASFVDMKPAPSTEQTPMFPMIPIHRN